MCAVNGAIVVDEGSDSPHQFAVLHHVAFFPVFELNVTFISAAALIDKRQLVSSCDLYDRGYLETGKAWELK